MKIKNKILISVDASDLIKGKFINNEITEIGDRCFWDLPELISVECLNVEKVGSDCLSANAMLKSVNLPKATTFGLYCLSSNAMLKAVNLPKATTFGLYCLYNNAMLKAVNLPKATTFGSDCLSYNAMLKSVNLPKATTFGSDCLSSNAMLKSVNLPKATTFGLYCLYNNAMLKSLNLPKATTFGLDCLSYNAMLKSVRIYNHKLNVKDVDGYCFVIESQKTSKGIIIYSGYNLNSVKDKVINKTQCFVAEKGKFYAHGDTELKAIEDLNFKRVSERLKQAPIKANTIIDVRYYRLITGACELGVRSWMAQNGIAHEKITAKELLPILTRTNAYGLERFKKLITF